MYLRAGAIRGMKKLYKKFQIVLFTRCIRIEYVLNHFKLHGVEFDGVYTNCVKDSDAFEHSKFV
jgi:hypothetical protein